MFQSVKGYRTYAVAGVTILMGLGGLFTGKLDTGTAMDLILQGLTAAGLRAGLAASQPQA